MTFSKFEIQEIGVGLLYYVFYFVSDNKFTITSTRICYILLFKIKYDRLFLFFEICNLFLRHDGR